VDVVVDIVIQGLVIGSIYALLAVGLSFIFGIMHIVSFAQGEFYTLGAYAYWFFLTKSLFHIGFGIIGSAILSFIFVAIIAVLFEKLILSRIPQTPVTIPMLATIGFWIFSQNAVLMIAGAVYRSVPSPFAFKPILHILFTTVSTDRLFAACMAIGLLVTCHFLLHGTKMGKALRATVQDEEAALLMGLRIEKIRSWTWIVGCTLASIGGIIISPIFLIFPHMGDTVIFKAFVVVVLGGMGSFTGALFGGFIVGIAESLGAAYISGAYRDAISFVIVIIILLIKPTGLFSGSFGKARYVG
jgi:branched-chain amino acid transport system permease protein